MAPAATLGGWRRPAPYPPDAEHRAFITEMEARREPCGACPTGTLCYRPCCFPPRDYDMALHTDLCHVCYWESVPCEMRPSVSHECPTCRRPWPRARRKGATG